MSHGAQGRGRSCHASHLLRLRRRRRFRVLVVFVVVGFVSFVVGAQGLGQARVLEARAALALLGSQARRRELFFERLHIHSCKVHGVIRVARTGVIL